MFGTARDFAPKFIPEDLCKVGEEVNADNWESAAILLWPRSSAG